MKTVGQETQTLAQTGAQYPTISHLLAGPVDVHSALTLAYFAVKNCLTTVGVILHDGDGVLLIEPARAPAGAGVNIFLQEKAKYLRDTSFAQVALRGLSEELGLAPRDVTFHPGVVSWFENRLPRRRTEGIRTTKCIVYVAVRIKASAIIRLNPKEIRGMAYVTSCDDYMSAVRTIERSRPHKWIGQTEALMSAVDAGLLSGERWKEFRHQARLGQSTH